MNAQPKSKLPGVFQFTAYAVSPDRKGVRLVYQCQHNGKCHEFTESLQFPVRLPETEAVDNLLQYLHFAAGTSYYKLFVPECIEHEYAVSSEETSFWNEVYRHGLREFMFKNQIQEERIALFPEGDATNRASTGTVKRKGAALLGIGGGKDSIVAGELLKEIGMLGGAFVVVTNDVPAHVQEVADKMGVTLLVVRRQIDRGLKDLSSLPDAYNGHIPVSAIYAIIGCLLAVSRGHSYVTVGNESSSSIPGLQWRGLEINHQWSKSLHFEKRLQTRLEALGSEVMYFSPVRSLNSVSVAGLFSQYDKYFPVFTSDSSAFRIDPSRRPSSLWSLGSAKSLSSYILLLPWLEEQELRRIFGRDFLDEGDLESMLKNLLGVSDTRILECVGTPEELRISLEAALARGKGLHSRLVQQALAAGWVSRRERAWEPLIGELKAAGEHAFPPPLANRLIQVIETHLEECRGIQRNVAGQDGTSV